MLKKYGFRSMLCLSCIIITGPIQNPLPYNREHGVISEKQVSPMNFCFPFLKTPKPSNAKGYIYIYMMNKSELIKKKKKIVPQVEEGTRLRMK